ncbi:MAG: hypothetical protein HN842_07640 [Gammaproteobacteria bacterium]|nr:hypothetical protein [Gammaproteobacteria bacterium]
MKIEYLNKRRSGSKREPTGVIAALTLWLFYGGILSLSHAATIQLQEGTDYSHSILENRWDMSDSADLFPLRWVDNLQSAVLEEGLLSATPQDSDPHIWLKFPQIPSSLTTLGQQQPVIDADRFTRLSYYLWLPEQVIPGTPEAKGRIVWHHGGDSIESFDAAYSESELFPVYPGWHLYEFDLDTLVVGNGQPWQGGIEGLRVDPCMGCSAFKLDWARLSEVNSSVMELADISSDQILIDDDQNPNNGFLNVVTKNQENSFSFAHLPPGQYQLTPAPNEYALTSRGNLWDMEENSDLYWGGVSGWNSATIGNGSFSGTTVGGDPFLMLDLPQGKPIDTQRYSQLSLRIYLSEIPRVEPGLLLYWGEQPVTFTANSDFFPLQAGWNSVQIDLSQYAAWQGEVRSLRIDPLGGALDGVEVHLDEVTLSAGTEAITLHQQHSLIINAAAEIMLLDPHPYSGQDYATTLLGNTWDMNEWADVPSTAHVEQEQISGSRYSAYSTATSDPEGDPGVYLLFQQNQTPLDADIFSLLSVTMEVPFDANQQNELTRGAVARVAWKSDDWDSGLTTDDILLYPGLSTYLLDMRQAVWEPASERSWSGAVRYLRIDPLEFPESRPFELDEVRVMSLPQYRSMMPVQYQLHDPEQGAMEVDILIDGNLHQRNTARSDGVHTAWLDISTLQPGEHTLTLQVTDDLGNQQQTGLIVPFIKGTPTQLLENTESIDYSNPAPGTVRIHWSARPEAANYRFYYGYRGEEMVGHITVEGRQSELNFTNIAAGHYVIALTRLDQQGEESGFIDYREVDVE